MGGRLNNIVGIFLFLQITTTYRGGVYLNIGYYAPLTNKHKTHRIHIIPFFEKAILYFQILFYKSMNVKQEKVYMVHTCDYF